MDLNFGTPARLERQIAQDLMDTQSEFDLSLPASNTRDISASITRTPLGPSNRHNSSFSRPSDSTEASVTSPAKHTQLATPHTHRQPVSLAAAVHNARDHPDNHGAYVSNAISTSSSNSSVSDSPHLAQFPDPYSHVRSTSPPLTSTPQRTVGPASTIGSRSRTIMTARPLPPSSAHDTATDRYDDTTKTSASASRRPHSARSASTLLDDLTESSISPDDVSRHEPNFQEAHTNNIEHQQHQLDTRDLVVHDAPSAASSSRNQSPTSSRIGGAAAGDAIDWRQRRAQRRQLVQVDESAVDDDESQVQPDPHSHNMGSTQSAGTITTRAESVAETEDNATAYSSPAAARLARQSLLAHTALNSALLPETATNTPGRPLQGNPATPKQVSASEERAKMKQYLLNSVKATAKVRTRTGRSSDAHLDAVDRLKAQAQLHHTLGSRSEGDAAITEDGSPATSTDPTPRRRMDRLGKANTFAAGRTPLPKGGVAELLRRGALFGVADSSVGSSAAVESPLRAGPWAAEQAKDDEVASAVDSTTTHSEASSNDLALAPNGSKHGAMGLRANTSFPGLGAADVGTEANSFARPRVDAAKLALYQSKLNARLDAENEELKHERDQLMQKLAKLGATSSNQSAQADFEAVTQRMQAESERADALDKEAQELADLLDEKEKEIESLKSAQSASQASKEEREQHLQGEIEELQGLLREKDEDLEELETRLERERTQMEEQVQQAKAFSFQTLDRIETERDQALERVRTLQKELAELKEGHTGPASAAHVEKEDVSALHHRITELESENDKLAKQLESKDGTIQQANYELEALHEEVISGAARLRGLEHSLNVANAQLSKNGGMNEEADESQALQRESLKEKLRDAQAYILKLEAGAGEQGISPPSSVRNEKIRFLERQKAELEERVQQYREMISKGVGTNLANLSKDGDEGDGASLRPLTSGRTHLGSSPLPKSVMSLRDISAVKTPRSPGSLSEASWLYNESSLGAGNVVDRIVYLEGALDEANASIDAKLQQLDEAGVAHLTLAERLEQAHDRIAELEAEIERLRMAGGHNGDSSSVSPNKSVSQRQKVFADVHAQLEALKSRWAADHDKLQQRERDLERRERELQDRSAEKHHYQEVLAELNRFKEAASSLQQDLQHERAKQRSKLAETRAASQQKESIEGSLSRTQAELEMVKRKLEEKMDGLQSLGRQYMQKAVQPESSMGHREKEQLECQTERLAERFQAVQSEVELLKAERNDLLSQRADLHKKFAAANENHEQVLADLATSRAALAEHQTQLDEQIEQMEAAHAALRSKKVAYEKITGDRDRLRAERDLIVHDVGMFEQELRTLRREADRQGADLEALRAEREEVRRRLASDGEAKNRERAEFMVQVRTLVHQLKSKTAEVDSIKNKLDELERSRTSAPPPYVEEHSLIAARKMHEAECKGLMLQIKYFKLRLEREMDLRADLSHQKQYISLLLQGLTRSDTQLGRLIFDLNLQHHARDTVRRPDEIKRRWAKALNASIAVARMQLLANKAKRVNEIKQNLQKAHEEVKSRRNVLPVQQQPQQQSATGLVGPKADFAAHRR
ncbi:related to Cingulin [Melanopsichium pennsylvanicum]|uniref:Related to Cingulin n=2 Tax=Melanopsichium pennsylvanicum TaxID=63383 RepID=A0AAJ5C4F7_9BASI|nr:related to Cingulin [Melanopsichium pennsylvanicum 4]SNX83597.1 related to Cingulin [Melanopsichium pennsylvanicum]